MPLYNDELIPETIILSSTVNSCATSVDTLAISAAAVISVTPRESLCKSPTILNSGVLGSKSFLSG